MIKKIFKALIMGMRESLFLQFCVHSFAMLGWLPALVMVMLTIFNINLSQEELLAVVLAAAMVGPFIAGYISHCIDAVKFSQSNNCSFSEAWSATELPITDEY